jgi:hypothetical protein
MPPQIKQKLSLDLLEVCKWAAEELNIQPEYLEGHPNIVLRQPHNVLWQLLFAPYNLPSNDTYIDWYLEPYDINNWDEDKQTWIENIVEVRDQFSQLLMKQYHFNIGDSFLFEVSW